MRGNKGPYNKARTALALYPRDGDTTGLVLSATKCNDGDLPKPRGLIVDRSTLSYREDPDFDVDQYRAEMKAKPGNRTAAKVSTDDVVKAVQQGNRKAADIVASFKGRASTRTVENALKTAVDFGHLERISPGVYILGPTLSVKK